MKFIKLIFVSSLIFTMFSGTTTRAEIKKSYVAEVVRLRGEATQLPPTAHMATPVAIGDKFVEDTSIVTGPKSFLKIKFMDGSEMNVGPESKIVIAEMKKQSPGVISLLKGKIRTEVHRDSENGANKFFIKTRTAAMGVRGTEFQTIYNPDNRVTSLLTYKGEVAMARLDEATFEHLEEQESTTKVVERNEVTKDVEVKEVPAAKSNEAAELNKVLKSTKTVLVPPGQNSFASASLKKASLPVKISPAQFEVLYKNNEFQEKAQTNVNPLSQTEKKVIPSLKIAQQKVPAEGLYNEKTGDFAPKAGGYIDLNTGLYVAPGPDAKLDKDFGVYVSEKVGDVDAETGQYVAPKGLVLDAKKGFVLAGDAEKKPELLALREDLNKTIAKDIVVKEEEETAAPFNINEKFIRDRISLSFWGLNQNLKITPDQSNSSAFSIDSKDSLRLGLQWAMASTNRFSPMINFDYGAIDLGGGAATQVSDKTLALSFGTQYALSKRVNLFGKVGLHQEHYINESAAYTYSLDKVTLTRLTLGSQAEWSFGRKFSLDAQVAGFFTFRKKINNLIIKNGTGVSLEVLPKYSIGDHRWIGLGLQSEWQQQQVLGSRAVANNKGERKTSGLILKYIVDL